MQGILLVDKPRDFTSFDVVAKARGMLKTRKIGHAGTLDPMATGVLPLFVGNATKAVDLLPDSRKRYTATFRLGIATDTQDITGTILSERPVTVGRAEVERALEGFRGEILQLPPMYSAVKVGGKRLYDLARKGVEVERKPRPIRIEELTLLESDEPSGEYRIEVLCSGGTYIRTLCHDLGEALGCGGALTSLRRTMAAGFLLKGCLPLSEAQALAEAGRLGERLLPVETAFASLPRLTLTPHQEPLFRNGVKITLLPESGEEGQARYAVYAPGGGFLALADIDRVSGTLLSRKLFG